jgi:hypothetical protein
LPAHVVVYYVTALAL